MTLKQEIEAITQDQLPLQQALSRSSAVADSPHTAIILSFSDTPEFISAKVGICYAGIIAGCSCTDDPTPLSENPEYCEIAITIAKQNGEMTIEQISRDD